MTPVYLIVTLCVMAEPDRCVTRQEELGESVVACALLAPRVLPALRPPGWRIARWSCKAGVAA